MNELNKKIIKEIKRNTLVYKIYTIITCIFCIVFVLAIATLSWYTLSVNPEIKGLKANMSGSGLIYVNTTNDKDTYSFSKELNIKDDIAGLKPISTVDGINWFICKYDLQGNILSSSKASSSGITQYNYLKFPYGGNVTKSDEKSYLNNAIDNNRNLDYLDFGYYVYTDVYLINYTEDCDVYLSAPSNTHLDDIEYEESEHAGTFIKSYTVDENNNITLIEGGTSSSIRIGFKNLGSVLPVNLAEDLTPNKYSGEVENENLYYTDIVMDDFIILEPNADERSNINDEDCSPDIYVDGFNLKILKDNNESLEGYIQTYPIKLKDTSVNSANNIIVTSDRNQMRSKFRTIDGSTSRLNENTLITQSKATWNTDVEVTSNLTSSNIANMGTFRNGSEFYEHESIENNDYTLQSYGNGYLSSKFENDNSENEENNIASIPITHLTEGIPNKIRIYIWIEGQDIDCWNNIVDNHFLVNIEFAE